MSEVDLGRFFRILRKWLWLIILSIAVVAGTSYYASKSMPATYRTSITIMVGEDTTNPNLRAEEIATSQRLAGTYAEMARRQPVLEGTIESLGLQTTWWELRDNVLTTHAGTSQFFELRVVGDDPPKVKAIADEIARQLALQSPTAQQMAQMEMRRQFVQEQLNGLQLDIRQAEAALAEKQAYLQKEVSARGVLDLQDEVRALELKLTNWRSAYATLLASYQSQTKGPNTLSVIEPSFVPTEPISPNVRANVSVAVGLGLLLVMGILVLLEFIYGTLSTSQDVEQVLVLPTLGSIVNMGKDANSMDGPIALREPRSPVSEAYRVLRVNLQLACLDDRVLTLLVTSPGVQEGKSITSANLATSFAQAGKGTILVDTDFRRPSLHRYFGIDNKIGITSLFVDEFVKAADGQVKEPGSWTQSTRRHEAGDLERSLEASLVPTKVPGLRLLPSGPTPLNPAELLASSRMDDILGLLRDMADVLILDSPPVLPVADTRTLAAKVGGVVLVIEANATRAKAAHLAKEAILHAHSRVLGVILNRTPRDSFAYHYRYQEDEPKRLSAMWHILRERTTGLTRKALQKWAELRAVVTKARPVGARCWRKVLLAAKRLWFSLWANTRRLPWTRTAASEVEDGGSVKFD